MPFRGHFFVSYFFVSLQPVYVISRFKRFFVMPKMKTNSGAKKRFALTGTGKIKRKHAYHSHILTKKSNKRKHNLVKTTLVSDGDSTRIKLLLTI